MFNEEEKSYPEAVIELCERNLAINKILTRREKGEITKIVAYNKIEELVYDDWYLEQIRQKS